MDMRLKERLIGATVLVLAAVLFIPMVLDGPDMDRRVSRSVPLPAPEDDAERRTVRIDLAAAGDAAAESTRPMVASREPAAIDLVPAQERDAAEAAPGNVPTDDAPPETSPPASAASDPAPPASEPAGGTADAPWTVQAGSFTRKDNAETLAAELRALGFPAYVSRFDDADRVHFRVRIGGYPSRDAAQEMADEIRAKTGEPARPAPAN